ncbi:AcrR family transcriptional regulator [Nakamurella sp. UYEF19]|uniref:TetR/AcrR family transcriptional regulator n=1 Tax=Nakamurella sp. UYEF19 TaxID=1756392 RepID=UPI0033943CF6
MLNCLSYVYASGMPTSGARIQHRRERVEREILDQAVHVLAERGPDSVTLRGLAADLGMAASGVHYYFPARDDLLARLIVATFDSLALDVSAPGDAQGDPVAAFRSAAHRYVTWANAHADQFALAHSRTAARLKDRAGVLPAKDRAVRALMAPLLAALELAPPPPSTMQVSPTLRRQIKAWSTAIGDTTSVVQVRVAALTAYTVVHGYATLTSTASLPRELLEDGGLALLDAHLDCLVAGAVLHP